MFTCQGRAASCLMTLLFFLPKRTYISMAAKMASANNYIFQYNSGLWNGNRWTGLPAKPCCHWRPLLPGTQRRWPQLQPPPCEHADKGRTLKMKQRQARNAGAPGIALSKLLFERKKHAGHCYSDFLSLALNP